MKKLRILFIGNSHTYYNDMPNMVAEKSRKEGYDCEVTMIAHGGWFLEQHVQEPDVRFNILYGHYDYVVLQEHSHPFGPEEKLFDAVRQLNTWIREANALLAPVGELWWEYRKNHPEVEMYAEDNAHASREGSEFAADCIWNTIKESCEQ